MKDFSRSPNRVLLIKPSSMGDVIHALPVLAALHRAWPAAEIKWLIDPLSEPLVKDHPAITGTILFPRNRFRGFLGWGRSLSWARMLRTWKPDLAVDLQGLFRSALMARLSGASHIVGLSDAREGASLFYSAIAHVDKKDHAVKRYLAVLDLLGIPAGVPEFTLPQGKLPKDFLLTQPFVVLHPYARGAGKNLTQEQVTAFARALEILPVILVGRGETMKDLPPNVIDKSNQTTLLELISVLRSAAFIVSSDSGPMHLAAALQPGKTLAIHRWTDPLRVGPWAKESWVWKNGKIIHVDQLTEEFRAPGKTPNLEEMREIGLQVLQQMGMIRTS